MQGLAVEYSAKIENIQKLRAIAALLVLLLHTIAAEKTYVGANLLLPTSLDIGHAGVDLFFLISGFVIAYTTNAAAKRRPLLFIRARLIRIYPLYWLALVVMLLLNFVFTGTAPLFPKLWYDLLLLPFGEPPSLVVAWTLIHELYFYLVFTVLLCLSLRQFPRLLAGWLLLIVFGGGLRLNTLSPLMDLVFHPLTAEFIVGSCICWLVMGGYREKGRFCLLTGSCWLVVIAVWRTVAVDTIFPGNWDRLLLCLPPLALTLYGAVVCELTGDNRFAAGWPGRALFLLGDASYSLYLFHIPVLMLVGELLARYLSGGIMASILLYFLGPSIAIGGAILIHIHVEKPLLRALRKQAQLHRMSML